MCTKMCAKIDWLTFFPSCSFPLFFQRIFRASRVSGLNHLVFVCLLLETVSQSFRPCSKRVSSSLSTTISFLALSESNLTYAQWPLRLVSPRTTFPLAYITVSRAKKTLLMSCLIRLLVGMALSLKFRQ